jgi:hypothetical protein
MKQEVPPDALIQIICAWHGCKKVCFVADILPAGWKCIMVGEKIDARITDVDGVLCPDHFKQLLSLLKVGSIPQNKGLTKQ